MDGQLNGGEMVPGQRVLEGTDLDIAYNLQGEDLILRVNKAGVLVFRVQPKEAAGHRLLEHLVRQLGAARIGAVQGQAHHNAHQKSDTPCVRRPASNSI
jgi:hypothetical protein